MVAAAFGLALAASWPAAPALAQDAPDDEVFVTPDAGGPVLAEPEPEPAPPVAPDLFGFTTVRLGQTPLDNIWRAAAWSAMPVNNEELDALVARLQTLPVRERAQQANIWVNSRVRYARDPRNYSHRWGNLASTLAEGCGEREDIAIAKLQLLAAAGVPRSDMFLVLVEDWRHVAEDYLLVIRDGEGLYVLDSKQNAFEDPNQTRRYVPLLAVSADGGWIFGRRGVPGALGFSVANLRSVASVSATPIAVDPARGQPGVAGRR